MTNEAPRPPEPTAEGLIRDLGLEVHPEGGHFREIYRSTATVRRGEEVRSALTTIYFLLAAGEYSRWHVVASDEAWHFYSGAPLELLCYDSLQGRFEPVLLGPPGAPGARSVHVVPAGHWQAARSTGAYSLTGCTVAPGFEFGDFAFVRDVPGHESAFADDLEGHRGLL